MIAPRPRAATPAAPRTTTDPGSTVPVLPTSDRDTLAEHLVRTGIAGDVPTDRSSNINNLRGLAARDPHYMFGVDVADHWDETSLLGLMSERVGISADPTFESGQDHIDVELTVARLEAYADVVRDAVASGTSVLLGSGHPSALAWLHASVGRAVRHAGGTVLRLEQALGEDFVRDGRTLLVDGPEPGEVRQVEGVVVRYKDGNLLHTHYPHYMEATLDAFAAVGVVPGLVVADHGMSAAAGRRGIRTIGIADCNDPALFVAEAQGSVEVVVPMDDGMPPALLAPVADFVLSRAGLVDPAR